MAIHIREKMKKYNFSYENDDLFIYKPGERSTGSVELGDIVFDFNKNKELVAIEFINASQTLKEFTKCKNTYNILNHLKECRIDIKQKGNSLMITIVLISAENKLTQTLSIPSIKEQSPSLVYT